MNLCHDKQQDQAVYKTAKDIFRNTKNETVKHFMAKAMIELFLRGVNPCHEK